MTPELDLDQLLDELAAAWTDRDGHHSERYIDELMLPWDEQSQERHDDWSRCYARYEKAEAALAQFALARVAKTEPAPEREDTGGLS